MTRPYLPWDWYWIIANDVDKVFSSKLGNYLLSTDPTYVTWMATGGVPSRIATEVELSELLEPLGLIGPIVLPSSVNAERDRRINLGCLFDGHMFQSRLEDQKRVNGAVTVATIALLFGAQPGNLRWHGGTEDFSWLSMDNVLVPMDVMKVMDFGKAMAIHESSHVFAARALKDMTPIPRNFRDNSYWP